MATITGNYVDADPTQWFTLDYTFANSKFTWSVTAHASFTSYWNAIFGLTVNVGGNSYYKGDIDWRNYTPNTVVYSGTTNLTDCTISNGAVALSVSGNFYYNTWNTDYKSSGSGTCAVAPPTVSALTYTATNKYSNMVISGRSVITFTMKGTSQTGSSTITYNLFQDGSAISTSTGTSGSNKTVQVTAPSAGSHSYYYRATDGNGTTSTSGSISITTYAYTQPSFNSISAVRWTTGTSSGTASDEGKYCKATANWNVGKVGTTNLTTTLKISTSSPAHSATTTTNGATLYLGSADYSPDNSYTVTFKLYDNYTGEANGVVRTDTLTMGGRGLDFIYQNGHYGVAVGRKAVANQFLVNAGYTQIAGGGLAVTGGEISASAGNIWAGTNGDTTAERAIGVQSGAGRLYMYSNASATGNRGIYLQAHGTGLAKGILTVDTNNSTTFSGEAFIFRQASSLTTQFTVGYNHNYSTTRVTRSSGWTIANQYHRQWGRFCQLTLIFNMASSGTAYTGNRLFNGTLTSYPPAQIVTGAGFLTANSGGSHSFGGYINTNGEIVLACQDDITYAGGQAFISFTYTW